MPEIWIPYGDVETLVTVQAENLHEVIECRDEESSLQLPELSEGSKIYALDRCTPTIDALRKMSDTIEKTKSFIMSRRPEVIQRLLPDLKERILQYEYIAKVDKSGELTFLKEKQQNFLFLSTILPDVIFGIIEPKINAALELIEGAKEYVFGKGLDIAKKPLDKGENYRIANELGEKLAGSSIGIVPCRGKALKVLSETEIKDASSFLHQINTSQEKGIIAGIGGMGYDDDLTKTLRYAWNAVPCLKEGGPLVIISECSEGLGSKAMEMYVSGRLKQEYIQRSRYVEGMESVILLFELKKRFEVFLLSGLAEVYVKKRLGINSVSSTKEAVNRAINKMQRSGKLSIVMRAAETCLNLTPSQA